MTRSARSPQPDGYALGTGFDLAVMCDIRVATDRATFAHPELRLGGVPLFTPLKLIVGDGWARRLCLDATPIDAAAAERIGLVTDVVAPDDLRRRARAIAASVAQAPMNVLRETKALFGANPDPQTWLVTDHDDVFEAGRTIGRAPKQSEVDLSAASEPGEITPGEPPNQSVRRAARAWRLLQ